MIVLEITEDFRSKVDESAILAAAQATFRHQLVNADAELTIVISDDEALQNLNVQFRGINAPTDVLSFSADFIDPENEAPYLGDIVISYPRAVEQASAGGHSAVGLS